MPDIEQVVADTVREVKAFGDNIKELKSSLDKSVADIRAKAESSDQNSAEVKNDLKALSESVTLRLTAVEELAKKAESTTAALKTSSEEVERKLNKLRLMGSSSLTHADQLKAYQMFARQAILRDSNKKSVIDDGDIEARLQEVTDYAKQAKSYLRWGDAQSNPNLDLKAMSVGSDPDGGYWVTPVMMTRILSKVYESSPMRAICDVQTISTDALEFPIDDGEFGYGWVGEQETRSETTTSSTGVQRIPVHELYAEPRATQKLLDDSAVDVESWIADKIGQRFGRIEATGFVSGNGIKKPRGFLTYSDGTTRGYIEQYQSAVAASFNFDDVITLMTKLKEFYRAGAVFLCQRTTVGTMLLLKDGNGQYIWRPGATAGEPSVLMGHQVYMAADMEAVGSAALALAFGNFKMGYTIVDRLGISTLRDPFTAKPFVKFYTRKRVGGDVTEFEAIKLLKCGA